MEEDFGDVGLFTRTAAAAAATTTTDFAAAAVAASCCCCFFASVHGEMEDAVTNIT